MINRRGVSPVVATVLLLVLTIIIGGIVFSVVIPFVNNKLGESKACLDTFDGVEFPESKFNCLYTTSGDKKTGFSVKINKENIKGVRVALVDSNGNSDVFDIINGTINSKLKMPGANFGDPLTFPGAGGQRTYIVNNTYDKAEISALTDSGDVCAVADIVEFKLCSSGVIL